MKIKFSTSSYLINDLKNDLIQLDKDFGLPCKFESSFCANTESRLPGEIAVAFYGPKEINQGYPEIEINPQYFQEDKSVRLLFFQYLAAKFPDL